MKSWENVLIKPDESIIDVIRIIDKGGLKIALVVDSERKLLGTVTDGDVRRGILQSIDLKNQVRLIMNQNPVTVSKADQGQTGKILKLMQDKNLDQIPVLGPSGNVVDLLVLSQLSGITEVYDNPIVIMAGGRGSRLAELTEDCPKPLLKIGEKPILERIVEQLCDQGFFNFYISVNYKMHQIMDYFGDGSKWGAEITYLQENEPLGTAGALSLLPELPKKPLVLMNGDLMTNIDMKMLLNYHNTRGADATMSIRQFEFQVPFGVVETNQHEFVGLDEKPIQRFFVNAGIYVINPGLLELIPKDRYIDTTTFFQMAKEKNYKTFVFPIREEWLDIGRPDDFKLANSKFKNE